MPEDTTGSDWVCMTTRKRPAREKQHGIHYTPQGLAEAVARRLVLACTVPEERALVVGDPACGDGSLLSAVASAAGARGIPVRLVGNDLDPAAIAQTAERLAAHADVSLSVRDFLAGINNGDGDLFSQVAPALEVDAFIANPPYVRTQVLGAEHAQDLAQRFGLTGRVDLAYAFCMAMVDALPLGGAFAFIVSNKFMTIKAGESLRRYLQQEAEILDVWDLGDSKLFSAAVLPCVIVGRRSPGAFQEGTPFRSVYTTGKTPARGDAIECATEEQLLHHFNTEAAGSRFEWRGKVLELRAGTLQVKPNDGTWVLSDSSAAGVQARLQASKARLFSEVMKVKVGIKTTADAIYIRNDWHTIPDEVRPEDDLLWPIRMTEDVGRWMSPAAASLTHRTLYPFERAARKRAPVDLSRFPRAAAYLERHRVVLEGRKYVIEAGRHWWEPWVPHQPWMWQQPRIIFPEISERPGFSLDESGVIANGPIFWAHTLAEGETDLLRAACAIANTAFAVEYYDMFSGTRLYAGRRRWNAQHVGQLPFPARDADVTRLANLHDHALEVIRNGGDAAEVEAEADRICRSLFAGV